MILFFKMESFKSAFSFCLGKIVKYIMLTNQFILPNEAFIFLTCKCASVKTHVLFINYTLGCLCIPQTTTKTSLARSKDILSKNSVDFFGSNQQSLSLIWCFIESIPLLPETHTFKAHLSTWLRWKFFLLKFSHKIEHHTTEVKSLRVTQVLGSAMCCPKPKFAWRCKDMKTCMQ